MVHLCVHRVAPTFCCLDHHMDTYSNETEYKPKEVHSSHFITSKFSGKRQGADFLKIKQNIKDFFLQNIKDFFYKRFLLATLLEICVTDQALGQYKVVTKFSSTQLYLFE